MDADHNHDELVLAVSRIVDSATEPLRDDEPVWDPLEAVLPAAQCDGFMWMGHATARGRRVELYKHGITRRYLVVDAHGQAYRFENDQLEPVSTPDAIETVFAGLEAMGWMRETPYDDDFKAARNAVFGQHGLTVIS